MRRVRPFVLRQLVALRRRQPLPPPMALPLAGSFTVAAALVELAARPAFGRAPFTLFYLAVVGSSMAGGLLPGFVAVVASAALGFSLFLRPNGGELLPDVALTVAFALVASVLHLTLVALRSSGRRQARLTSEARRERSALADTLRIRDEFLAVAGHELKTPLTALQLQLEGLARAVRQRRPGFEALADERLGRSLGHLERLQVLIRDMLDASRLSRAGVELARERLDFVDVVDGVVQRLSGPAARVGSPIHLAHDGPLEGRFDRARLEQLATHLVANAVKYGMGHPVEVELRREGSQARLSVRDSGIGISPEDAQRLFQRFSRVAPRENYGGLGLGLWVVRRIVESAGGSVEVRSAPGSGATFTVRLPLSPEVRT